MSILFEPKAIGNLVLKNRFIKSSTAESMAGSNGEVTPSMLEFYEAIARGMEQAVRATKSLDNLKISEWLHARTKADPVRTILGPFQWDERGVTKDRSSLVMQWSGNKLNLVFPTDEFESVHDFIYPKPAM